MSRFLFGGAGFGGIVSSFGRPAVRRWSALGFRAGPSAATVPRVAVKRAALLAPDADPQGAAEHAAEELDSLAVTTGLHSAVACIDPARQELVLFSLWDTPQARFVDAPEGQAEIARLVPAGRLGQPEEVGELIAFLVSGRSPFTTGQAVRFTGGWP